MGEQVAGELRRVAAGAGHPLDAEQDRPSGPRRPPRRPPRRAARRRRRRAAPAPRRAPTRSPPKATSWSSVPSASRKLPEAERAIIATAPSSTSIPSAAATRPQHLGDLLQRGALEVEALAAIGDRRHHLVGLGGGEDEDGVRRRLLQGLQEGVPGLFGQHVGLVEDVDLPAAGGGRVGDPLAQVADVIDRAVGGGVHLDHVDRGAGGDRQAGLAFAAGGDRRARRARS